MYTCPAIDNSGWKGFSSLTFSHDVQSHKEKCGSWNNTICSLQMRQKTEIEDTAQIRTRATPTDEEIIRLQITHCATPQAPLKFKVSH